jgi:hypothetical protein
MKRAVNAALRIYLSTALIVMKRPSFASLDLWHPPRSMQLIGGPQTPLLKTPAVFARLERRSKKIFPCTC